MSYEQIMLSFGIPGTWELMIIGAGVLVIIGIIILVSGVFEKKPPR